MSSKLKVQPIPNYGGNSAENATRNANEKKQHSVLAPTLKCVNEDDLRHAAVLQQACQFFMTRKELDENISRGGRELYMERTTEENRTTAKNDAL